VSDQRLHIAIDVGVAEDQIRGHLCDGVREPRQFVGWLGLIGELDGMLGSRRQEIADPAVAPHVPVASEDGDGGCEKGGGGSR
jgi:hypothetical protein